VRHFGAFIYGSAAPSLFADRVAVVCGTLVPVIGLVQVGEQSMADRYTYVPSLGVLILAVWGAYELIRRWRYHGIALSVAGLAGIILCLASTRQQLGYWQTVKHCSGTRLKSPRTMTLPTTASAPRSQERPNQRGHQRISGSSPPQTGLRRCSLQPRQCLLN